MELPDGKLLVLFDGVCNLCNRSVQLVLRRDKQDRFRFAPIQSEIGQHLMAERGIDTLNVDSIILIDPGVAYYLKSDAALQTARYLKGYGWLPILFGWIPRKLRDMVYDWVARNRYKWYGRREACMVPDAAVLNKFLG